MRQVGAPRHDPVPIGKATTPPFVKLPNPAALFADRATRFAVLAETHELGPYLQFLAALSQAQHGTLHDLPKPERPAEDALARAHQHRMPSLDHFRLAADPVAEATFKRLLTACETIPMPDAARLALSQIRGPEPAWLDMARAALTGAVPAEAVGGHVFAAAALQVHFARMAALLDGSMLGPVRDGACPACGGPPVSSLVVEWPGAHGARFCACALCGVLWNYVRIKCTLCGSTKGIGYQEVAGGSGAVKAETCDACRRYVKLLQQNNDPSLDPVADDVATLALDLLLRDSGYRRGGVNPFLVGY